MRNSRPFRTVSLSLIVAVLLLAGAPKRAKADSLLDLKTLYYEESGDRIKVIAPMAAWQKEWDSGYSIRVEGIYNSISGATPTGAPQAAAPAISPAPVKVRTIRAPVVRPVDPGGDDDDEDDDEDDDDKTSAKGRAVARASQLPVSAAAYNTLAGATPPTPPPPTPTPKPKPGKTTPATAPAAPAASNTGKIPMADFADTRTAVNLEVSRRLGNHLPSVALSFSSENDYVSRGVALKDAIDFNKKNTTLLLGVGGSSDLIEAEGQPEEDKTTIDLLLGVTQVINPLTLASLTATLGRTDGYLSDPYKVAEVNGVLLPESRPDTKDRQILYASLSRFFPSLNGSVETSYRFYNDSFGIQAHTAALAWYQKIGEHWIVRPLVRYYMQSEADFYAVRFTGTPDDYSSDYRISEMNSFGGGLKVIWSPNSRLSMDVSYERYEQQGQDGVTPDSLYPSANMIMLGVRLWF